MATIRHGNVPVLLVVDAQVGVMQHAWEAQRVVANLALAVQRARAAGVPVLWVQHADATLPEDGPAWALVPELQPAPGEARIGKRYNSAFEDTPLEIKLGHLGATRVVLAGAATNWCIRATAYAALDRGYDVTLVADAHTASPIDLDDGSRIEPRDVIRDLNLVMTWLEYPGRRNQVVATEALDFKAT